MKMLINGAAMTTRGDAHAELARALKLPGYYGANLDALWDCASTMEADAAMVCPGAMLNALGSYGCRLLKTLFDAAEENPDFHFRIVDDAETPPEEDDEQKMQF